MKKSQPIRMCIVCRQRFPQNSLIRLKEEQKEVIAYDGRGRSFYLCDTCSRDEKRLKGVAKRFRQDIEQLRTVIETLQNENKERPDEQKGVDE